MQPEKTFINRVHRQLPPEKELHKEKMHNAYRGGTADMWYSSYRNDLWIEYKVVGPYVRVPEFVKPNLSKLQCLWALRRQMEGRDVWIATLVRGALKDFAEKYPELPFKTSHGIVLLQRHCGDLVSRRSKLRWDAESLWLSDETRYISFPDNNELSRTRHKDVVLPVEIHSVKSFAAEIVKHCCK